MDREHEPLRPLLSLGRAAKPPSKSALSSLKLDLELEAGARAHFEVPAYYSDTYDWREHEAAWRPATVPGPDSLTPFQRNCEVSLSAALKARGAELAERSLYRTADGETIVEGRVVPINLDVWIQPDGAQAGFGKGTIRLEEWDARTPEELIDEFVKSVATILDRRAGAV